MDKPIPSHIRKWILDRNTLATYSKKRLRVTESLIQQAKQQALLDPEVG